jgi:hypothetical protein
MQLQPYYSEQLKAIANALNRPATPAWMIAAFSAVLGFIAGMLSRSIEPLLNERHQRRTMRRVVYFDIAELFVAVRSTMRFRGIPDHELPDWRRAQFNSTLKFKGEEYVSAKHDIFIQLPEAGPVYSAYQAFHCIIDDPASLHVNTNLALRIVARNVREGRLPKQHFKKFLGRRAGYFLAEVDQVTSEEEQMLADMKRGAIG